MTLYPVDFVGAGPGDPGLLTLTAVRLLEQADVVLHDRLVSAEVLALCAPGADLIPVGKQGFGASVPQHSIDALLCAHAETGARVVRLKGGDPAVFGRLDEELAALDAAGLRYRVHPGVTAASAAAASLSQSLTQRGRNTELRFVTGHDVAGFADHDWRALARPGAVAAVYMAKRAARFIQGRLLMHGADPATAVTAVFHASRPDERIVASTLARLPADLDGAQSDAPAILMLGLAPRVAQSGATPRHKEGQSI